MRAILAATIATAVAAKPTALRLGYFGEVQPFQAACARGWFDTAEVSVSCLPQSSGGNVVSKLDAGELDMSVLGSTPLAAAVSRGVDVVTAYVVHSKGRSQGLVVREGVGISSPWDLDGRHVVATPFGSTAHYHLSFAMNEFGIAPRLLDLSPGQIGAAWAAGTINATFVWGTHYYAALRDGGRLMLPASQLKDWGKETFNGLAVRRAFAAAAPAAVRRVVGVVASLDASYLRVRSGDRSGWGGGLWSIDDGAGLLASIADTVGSNGSDAAARREVWSQLADFEFVSVVAMCAARISLAFATERL